MNEETTQTPETTATDTENRDSPKEDSLIEQTDARIERFERATKDRREVLDREDKTYARNKLGGVTNNTPTPEKPKEVAATSGGSLFGGAPAGGSLFGGFKSD